MNVQDGTLIGGDAFKKLLGEDREKYVEVKRDLTAKEEAEMKIKLYSPCGCGSGMKFKYCCFKPKPIPPEADHGRGIADGKEG